MPATEVVFRKCLRCGYASHRDRGERFCIHCGIEMAGHCPRCHSAILHPWADHCPFCGRKHTAGYEGLAPEGGCKEDRK